jgi:hypothetical protein
MRDSANDAILEVILRATFLIVKEEIIDCAISKIVMCCWIRWWLRIHIVHPAYVELIGTDIVECTLGKIDDSSGSME